jgi:hypothetical protein
MGRRNHEACAYDPVTGYVYITEDRDFSGLYRFRPSALATIAPGSLDLGDLKAGGSLEMLRIVGKPKHDTTPYDASKGKPASFDVDWVPIADPLLVDAPVVADDPRIGGATKGNFYQGWVQGGAIFRRGEGCWYGNDRLYFACTNGGPTLPGYSNGLGQIWQLHLRSGKLTLIYASGSHEDLTSPDNVTVSPGGGLVLCEDKAVSFTGEFAHSLRALNNGGHIWDLCTSNVQVTWRQLNDAGIDANAFLGLSSTPSEADKDAIRDFRGEEWAGAAFTPNGKWLIVSNFNPGITFAITGPWAAFGL